MQISIMGTGYVGLVTGVCFAEMGNDVICADIDEAKIATLKTGQSPIYEPGLPELIQSNLKAGRLQFTTAIDQAVRSSQIVFIAVGTPSDHDGSADLTYVLKVAESIAEHMDGYRAIVTKSTVPVGTAMKVKSVVEQTLRKRGVEYDFDIISNPEFLKEGSAVEDCLLPSRVVVGAETERACELMKRLYEPFLVNGKPLHTMDLMSSEMTKYAANAMLATKISFMNELSRVCERVGADIESVRLGIGSDPRIGTQFIYPGIGFGGSCFPKDVRALIKTGEQVDEELQILKSVMATNEKQRRRFFERVRKHFNNDLTGRKLALWGLAFKPGTDDVREAPALDLITWLTEAGAQVVAFDPVAVETSKQALGEVKGLNFAPTPYDALNGVDALCVVTEWKPFREPNFAKMRSLMKDAVLFDGRNLYSPQMMHEHGFQYVSIGRQEVI